MSSRRLLTHFAIGSSAAILGCAGRPSSRPLWSPGTQLALHLERLWDRNVSITTRLVDTVSPPMLLDILRSNEIDPKLLFSMPPGGDVALWA